MPEPPESKPAPRASPDENLGQALVYSYDRANANTREVHRANSTAGALAELLLERGVLDREALEARVASIGADLERDYSGQGMGVALLEAERSKYEESEAPAIDCAARWHLCKGSCCKLTFPLSQEDVEEGVVHWDLRRPYVIAHAESGRCVHQETGSCRCSIYENRPQICRGYDCRKDKRIWLDFERRIPNPRLEDPDWPACVSANPEGAGPDAEPAPAGAPETAGSVPAPPEAPEMDLSGPWQPAGLVGDDTVIPPSARARVRRAANGLFDRVVRARIRLFGKPRSSFRVWGVSGLLSAVFLGILLTAIQGLSFAVLAALTATGCAVFLALAMATKIVTGEEKLIYYHHEVGILLAAGVLLRLLEQPILPYLELTLLAVGMFLAWGRVGCLMVGCCHGRPHAWGVRYGPGHADDGFPEHLTGVRLFPIQLLEAITVFGAVLWGTVLIVLGSPPGEALALYVMGYGAARFVFEFARGDADRPYLAGFSEAQWTSILLMSLAVVAGLRGDLPLHAWYVGSVALVAACGLAVACRRRLARIPTHEILHARHLDEVARVLRAARAFGANPPDRPDGEERDGSVLIGTTSQGFQLSAGKLEGEDVPLVHYGLSRRAGRLTTPVARVLERLVLALEHPDAPSQLISRAPGLFHLLVRSGRSEAVPPRG